MKKTLIALLFAVLPAGRLLAQSYGGPQPLNTETSATEREAGKVSCSIKIEYPTNAPRKLEQAYRSAILGMLISTAYMGEDAETTACVPEYDGELSEAPKYIADIFMTKARAELDEIKAEAGLTEEEATGYGLDAKVTKEASNPYYVTFSLTSYLYTGGAHGMPFTAYVTLDRASGKVYETTDIFPSNVLPKLRQIVNRHLTRAEANGEIGLFDKSEYGGSYPLPASGVALTGKGVVFQYQAYEIAPYASGQPKVEVPYAEVYSIMTPAGKKLSNFRPKDFQTRKR